MENFMKHPSQPIRTRYKVDLGFKKNLERILKKNTAQLLYGITLLAKTYGIRRIVKKEENILPVALLILSTPFIIFVVAITYDVCNQRKRARILEMNKQKLREKNLLKKKDQ